MIADRLLVDLHQGRCLAGLGPGAGPSLAIAPRAGGCARLTWVLTSATPLGKTNR